MQQQTSTDAGNPSSNMCALSAAHISPPISRRLLCLLSYVLYLLQSWRPVSTSASSSAQAKQQQKPAPSTPPAAPTADAQQQQQAQEAAVQQLAQHYQRSRMREFYNVHLSRELMLKLNVRSAQQLPRLKDIVLSVNAKDLHGKRYVSGVGHAGPLCAKQTSKQQACGQTMCQTCSLTAARLSHITIL
jgi:hypothetical protein